MRIMILAAVAALSLGVNAALKTDADDIKPIFLTLDGKQLDAVEAVRASISGQRVLKCTEVEAKASSKTGNVSLKKKSN